MSLATTFSRAQQGMAAPLVTVEADIAAGLPATHIVGLPEAAVREARDRVRAAIRNSAFDYPQRRITVNLAPAELPKSGGRFDLAIALGVLAAADQLPREALGSCEFLGELSLSGRLNPVPGVLPALHGARELGRRIVLPRANGAEAAILAGVEVYLADSLAEVCLWLRGEAELTRPAPGPPSMTVMGPDLAEVRGQPQARRALEIAAAGAHHLLMVGPPGSGKTMLAQRLPGLLPPLAAEEALELAMIRSVAGALPGIGAARPFRAPHHGASTAALIGGGSQPSPGEISLAHQGVLFLDELPEFGSKILEALREPLESGEIVLVRAAGRAAYPARFQLVAAMNPCPCGHAGEPRCHCSPERIRRYRGRISGPILDRIDLAIEVPALPLAALTAESSGAPEDSATVRQRVMAARERALARSGGPNAGLDPSTLQRCVALSPSLRGWLEQALTRFNLSGRGYHRLLKVALTLADLAGVERVGRDQLAEAMQYRWR